MVIRVKERPYDQFHDEEEEEREKIKKYKA